MPGTVFADIRSVSSYPHALAQCQKYLARELPEAQQPAANSTADAARVLGESGAAGEAAIAPRLAAERYGLTIVAEDVEDHPENQTRFVLLARSRVPRPTGHDKRASSASNGRTIPAACTASSASSRRATST